MQRPLFDESDPVRDPGAQIHTGRVGSIRYATTPASRDLIEAVLIELLAPPGAASHATDSSGLSDR